MAGNVRGAWLPRKQLLVFWPLPVGLVAGLIAGWEFSRRGAWFDLLPWEIYAVALVVLIGAVALWSERKRR